MVKKAYMKTIEMLLVIVLSSIFLLVVVPKQASVERTENPSYLISLEKNSQFRDFVNANNGCYDSNQGAVINRLVVDYLPDEYDYTICIGRKASSLPQKNLFVDTLFVSGNYTNINYKVVRLYYWAK